MNAEWQNAESQEEAFLENDQISVGFVLETLETTYSYSYARQFLNNLT